VRLNGRPSLGRERRRGPLFPSPTPAPAAAVSRRRALAVIGATVLAGPLPSPPALANTRATASTLWRVITNNGTLTPGARDGSRILVAGEATAEAWTLDGALAWRAPLVAPAHYQPRVFDGVVAAVGRKAASVLEAGDGRERWRASPRTLFGAPLIHGGRLYIGDGSDLVARDLRDGTVLWRHTMLENAKVHFAPAARRDVVFLGGGDGLLTALDAATGSVLWSVDRSDRWQYLRQLVLTRDGTVLVAGGYEDEVYGLDPADGAILWRFDAGNFVNSLLVGGGLVHFWSPTGWMIALDSRTGRPRWRSRTHRFNGRPGTDWGMIMAQPAADDRRLWVLDMDSTVHGLSLEDGRVVASARLPFPARPFLVPLGGGDLVVGSLGGELARVRIPDGPA